ncbi:MAG TPA: hypothetical protein VK155_02495 [Bacteroidales bacterium]|nr:hypothetical protein [Bacteroidales bacterium]
MKKTFLISLLVLFWPFLLRGQYTVGDGGDAATLSEAFWALISSGGELGDVTLEIISDITETSPVVVSPSGTNGTTYTSIKVFTNTSGLKVTGNISGPLFDIAGGTNLIIDGRVSGNGPADLAIYNTSVDPSASVIRFSGAAHDNTLEYCYLQGSGTGNTSGIIVFGAESSMSGNSNNAIRNNDITGYNGDRPANVIYSAGASGFENDANTIESNNIHDFLRTNASSNGIQLASYNTNWNIIANSFYESSDFTPAGSYAYNVIFLNGSATGTSITSNYIGGSGPACSGTWTKTNSFNSTFTAINVNAGNEAATNVQNNIISKFNWTNAAAATWTGIEASAGTINIGTITGNTIGAITGTGSIIVSDGASAYVYGINISGTSAVDCQNNIIGSITTASTGTTATSFYGINRTSGGATTISNNTIGNNASVNSINGSSVSSSGNQWVVGINNSGAGNITISGNLIANINNATTRNTTGALASGKIQGITTTSGNNTISDNIIHDLKIANANNNTGINTAVCGIMVSSSNSTNTITGNTIYNLSDSFLSFIGYVTGIYAGNSGCNNEISGNLVHSLTVTGASSIAAYTTGIRTSSTSGAASIYNNIITLSIGLDKSVNVYGIWEPGTSGATTNVYFNSVYIGGTVPSGLSTSYCLYNPGSSSSRNIRNNVFGNYRMTDGGTNLHYAIYFSGTGGILVCDYNDYFSADAAQGGIPGYFGGVRATLPIVINQDAFSYILDPAFAAPGSTDAADYTIAADLIGVSGTGISTDFGSIARVNPTMGAWERAQNFWTGALSSAWNNAANWSAGVIPLENASIFFSPSPSRNLNLDTDHSVRNITNASTYQVVTSGHKLTIKGAVQGIIDATSSSSIIAYAGTTPQTITETNFTSGKANSVLVDNISGLTLSSNFIIDNDLTINTGRSFTISAPYLLTVTGNIINNAGNNGLVIKSAGNGNDAKLINNSASVPATVELSLSGGIGSYGPTFHYFVPGVQSMSINNSGIPECAASLSLANFEGDLLLYDESKATTAKNAGWQYFDGYGNTSGFSQIQSSRGYNIYLPAADRMIFTGNLNGSAHSFNLSYTSGNPDPGWNLVGNPYPCNYDLTSIAALVDIGDDVDNTVYFNYEGGYGTYNVETGLGTLNGVSSGLYSNIMPPMQGFYVYARSSGKSLSLPVSGKTNSPAQPSRSKGAYLTGDEKSNELRKIKLSLINGSARDETVVCFNDKATFGFDGDYDAYKLFETDAPFRSTGSIKTFNIPSIYSQLNGTRYAVNFLPEPQDGVTRIPVSVRIKHAGSYNIQVSDFENLTGTKVTLRHGSVETLLGPGIVYTFKTDTGTYNNFELIIGESLPENKKALISEFKVWYNNDQLSIISPSDMKSGERRVTIFDTQGKLVFDDTNVFLTPENQVNLTVSLRKGFYLVNINEPLKQHVFKIVVLE